MISFDYHKGGAEYELFNLIRSLIDVPKFEAEKMLILLREAKDRSERLPLILSNFYHLYCRGYHFLRTLGLEYGLSIEIPLSGNYPAHHWNELSNDEKQAMLDSFYPTLDQELDRVITWLTSKKLILTGIAKEDGHYEYEDRRTDEERILFN